MARIDNTKRIVLEDFKDEDRDTVAKIAEIYNYFAEQVTNTINGNIEFENMQREVITLVVTVASNGVPTQVTRFTSEVGVLGINVISAINTTTLANYVTATPFISFSSSGNGVYTINHVAGLVAGDKYRLTLELIVN